MSTNKKAPNHYYKRRNRRNSKNVQSHLEHKQIIKQHTELERLNMVKKGEQKQITVEGIDYTLQHPGLLEGIRMRERATNDAGKMGEESIYRELMTHVIFLKEGGQTDFDYFEENPGFSEVIKEAMDFTFR